MFIKDGEMKGKVPRFSKQLWQALRKRSSPFFGKDACTFCTQAFTPGSALVNAHLYQNLVKCSAKSQILKTLVFHKM